MKKLGLFVVGCLLFAILSVWIEQSVAQPGTDCTIKGVIGKSGQKMYLIPGHSLYNSIIPDEAKGERWFCSSDMAERAGFVFVPDPKNPRLRPQEATPTPQPVSTDLSELESTSEPATTAETTQSAPEQPVPRPTEVPTPVPPTPTPMPPIATQEPDIVIQPESGPSTEESFPQTMPTGKFSIDELPISPEMQARIQEMLPALLAFLWVFLGIIALIILITIVVRWKIFVKAGEPGWGALIPIFSEFLMLKIAGLAWWWIILAFIPIVQIAFWVVWVFVRPFRTAENFGKGFLYGLGLFLPIISIFFWIHLAFSDAEYVGA